MDVSWKNDIVEIYEIIVEINLDQGAKNQTSNSSFVVFLYSLNGKIRIFGYFFEKKENNNSKTIGIKIESVKSDRLNIKNDEKQIFFPTRCIHRSTDYT